MASWLGIAVAARAQGKLEPITFALAWLPIGETAGWYVALEKKYFAEAGLDVTITRGFGSVDTLKRVAPGKATFGIADLGTMILLRNREGVRVRTVAMYLGRAPHAVFFRKDGAIKAPKDLEGKTIVCPATSANRVMFPAFAKKAGIDEKKVNWRLADPTVTIPTFAAGRADAVCEFQASGHIVAKQVGAPIAHFGYADYLPEFYGSGVIAHEDTIKQNPDLVRRFTKAALRGLEYAVKNPEEAIQILRKHAPENPADVALAEWRTSIELIMTPEAKKSGIGVMLPEKWAATYQLVTSIFELDASKDKPENLYTLEFQ
jgi:NitT/TauT family transport system substrate-binding protein